MPPSAVAEVKNGAGRGHKWCPGCKYLCKSAMANCPQCQRNLKGRRKPPSSGHGCPQRVPVAKRVISIVETMELAEDPPGEDESELLDEGDEETASLAPIEEEEAPETNSKGLNAVIPAPPSMLVRADSIGMPVFCRGFSANIIMGESEVESLRPPAALQGGSDDDCATDADGCNSSDDDMECDEAAAVLDSEAHTTALFAHFAGPHAPRFDDLPPLPPLWQPSPLTGAGGDLSGSAFFGL